jgi:phosphohistidine phosphatase
MRTVYIMRHGKSVWDIPDLDDHERPLSPKGLERTVKVARFLRSKWEMPDVILSSTAKRAKDTAGVMAVELGIDNDNMHFDRRLYDHNAENIFELFSMIPPEVYRILLVGHNPTITEFTSLILRKLTEDLPTSSLVGVELHTDLWAAASSCPATFKFFVNPGLLPELEQ